MFQKDVYHVNKVILVNNKFKSSPEQNHLIEEKLTTVQGLEVSEEL